MKTPFILPAPALAVIVPLLALLFLWTVGLQLGFMPFAIAALVLSFLALFAAWLEKPIKFIIVSLLWFAVAGFLGPRWYMPHGLWWILQAASRYVDEFLFAPIFAVLVMYVSQKGAIPAPRIAGLWLWIALLAGLSGYLNQSGIVSTLKYIELYFRYGVVFLVTAIHFEHKPSQYSAAGRLFLAFLVFQAAADIVWFVVFSRAFTMTGMVDYGVGTLGSSHTVTHITSIGIFIALSWALTAPTGERFRWWIGFIGLACLFWIGSAKHAIPLLAAGLLFIVLIVFGESMIRRVVALGIVAVVVAVMAQYADFGAHMLAMHSDRWYMPEQLEETGNTKLQAYKDVAKVLSREANWVYGAGPGKFASAVGTKNESALAVRYLYKDYDQFRYNRGGSIMGFGSNGIVSIWSELGYLGLLLYLSLYGFAFVHILNQVRLGKYDAVPWAKVLAISWCAWALFYVPLNALVDEFCAGLLPFATWVWAGMLWTPPSPISDKSTG